MTDTKEPSKLGKTQRQHLVARLIESQVVANQLALVELLATEGVLATQATVSRDLEDLGAIKVRMPGGESAYAIPALPKEQRAHQEKMVGSSEYLRPLMVFTRLASVWTCDHHHCSSRVSKLCKYGGQHAIINHDTRSCCASEPQNI